MRMNCLFTEGKDVSQLNSLPEGGALDAIFVNERHDSLDVTEVRLTHDIFFNLELKNVKFTNVDFRSSAFVQCCFQNAHIRDCDFRDCRFLDCNFVDTRLERCDFRSTNWYNSIINFDQVSGSIPERPQDGHLLLDGLRHNSLSRGNNLEARRFLLESMKQLTEHYRRRAFSKDMFYNHNRSGWDRVKGFFQWIGSWLTTFGGYGARPWLLLFGSVGLVVFVFSCYYFYAIPEHFNTPAGHSVKKAIWFSLLVLTSTLPPQLKPTDFETISEAVALESFLGLLVIGLVAAAFYRKLSIRQ